MTSRLIQTVAQMALASASVAPAFARDPARRMHADAVVVLREERT